MAGLGPLPVWDQPAYVDAGEEATAEPDSAQAQAVVAGLRMLHEKDDPRLCSDIPCLALLSANACGLAILCGVAAALREPAWLQGGADFHARVCGVTPGQTQQPFLYWPHPEDLSCGLCVQRCPDEDDFSRAAKVQVPKAEPLLVRELGVGTVKNISYSQRVILEEVHIYPTVPALGRFCIPAPGARVGGSPPEAALAAVTPGGLAAPRARDSMLPELRAALGERGPQLRRAVGGLRKVWPWFAVSVSVVPLLFGLLVAAAGVPWCAEGTVWALAVASGAGALGLGARLLASGAVQAEDFALATLNDLEVAVALAASWALLVGGVVMLVLVLAVRAQLQWAARSAEVAAEILGGGELALPLGLAAGMVAASQALISVLWLLFVEAAASAAWLHWPPEVPLVGAQATGLREEPDAEVIPGGPLVRGILRRPVFYCPAALLLASAAVWLRVLLALPAAMGRAAVAYLVAKWYFSEAGKPRFGRWPLCRALRVLTGAHLGGAVASACLHAALPSIALRAAAVAAHKCLAPWTAAVPGRRGRRGGGCCCSCAPSLGALASALGAAPAVEVACRAGHFHTAAGRAGRALGQALPAVQFLSGLPYLLEVPACACAWLSATSLVLFWRLWDQQHTDTSYVESQVPLAFLVGALAIAPTSAWLLPVTAGFDALLQCLMLDDASGGGRLEDRAPPPGAARWAASVGASRALWASTQTPAPLRALVFEAAHFVQVETARRAGRSAHGLDDSSYGYAPVGLEPPGGTDSGSGTDQ